MCWLDMYTYVLLSSVIASQVNNSLEDKFLFKICIFSVWLKWVVPHVTRPVSIFEPQVNFS